MKKTFLIIALFVFCSFTVAFAESSEASDADEVKREIVSVSSAVENQREYLNKRIVVVGMFMGLDGACKNPPQLRGYNWMIQDSDGGACLFARGMMPEGFSIRPRVGIGMKVAVEGVMRLHRERYFLGTTRGNKIRRKAFEEASKALKEKNKKTSLKEDVFSVTQVMTSAGLLKDRVFFVKGFYLPSSVDCDATSPSEFSSSEWAMEDLLGSCIVVEGPIPERPEPGIKEGALISVRARIGTTENDEEESTPFLISTPVMDE